MAPIGSDRACRPFSKSLEPSLDLPLAIVHAEVLDELQSQFLGPAAVQRLQKLVPSAIE